MTGFFGISGKKYQEVDTKPSYPEGFITEEAIIEAQYADNYADNVNHPSHYRVGGIETIDFIEAKGLNYHLGNVVKYITRADYKGNRLQDLKKAQWYLNRAILNLEHGE